MFSLVANTAPSAAGAAQPAKVLPTVAPRRNLLLASLPTEDLARVEAHLEIAWLNDRDRLFESEAPIRHVYFPETAVISLVNTLSDGGAVEVGTAGREGMVGLTLFLADETSSVMAFAQIPGIVSRMEARIFTRLVAESDALQRVLLRYTEAFLTQVALTAACNAMHLVEERCARWLLLTHDRVQGDTFPLRHEVLAFMLGVRRAGVTLAMNDLEDAGMVHCSGGEVQVVDRAKLEGASCECYQAMCAHFERLLPRPKASVA